MNDMQMCFNDWEKTYQILSFLDDPLAKKTAAQVCKNWNQMLYPHILHDQAQELMEKLPYILIANGYQKAAETVFIWESKWKTICQGFSECRTKEAAINFFNSIIKPVSEACGAQFLEQMKPDIVSNLSVAHYNRLIDQVMPRDKVAQPLLFPNNKDVQMGNAGDLHLLDLLNPLDDIKAIDDQQSIHGVDPQYASSSHSLSNTKEKAVTKRLAQQEIEALILRFQEQLQTGEIESAHQTILAIEQIKGDIDQETCDLREGVTLKICQRNGFRDAVDYLQVADQAGLDIQKTLLRCFKIHLHDDKQRLSDPEANLQFLQTCSKEMITDEIYLACSEATIKAFLKQPHSFDKTLVWASDPQCPSAKRHHQIQACIDCLSVWPLLPLESMENLIQAISDLSISSEDKDEIYFQFILEAIQHKHFSQEHEILILKVFHEIIANEKTKVELIKQLIGFHINVKSVKLIQGMILTGLKHHPQRDYFLASCVNWYFSQQIFKEADEIIRKMENPFLQAFMQARVILFLLEKDHIDQAIDQSYQQMDNIFIRDNLIKYLNTLGIKEKYDEASRFLARIPKQYHRYAEAMYCQVSLPLTEVEFNDAELLNQIERLSANQEHKIQTAMEGIQQLAYRDAAQFKFMRKLLARNQISTAMKYAGQHLDNPAIGAAILAYLESLCHVKKYDEAYSIIHQMLPEHEKDKANFIVEYRKSRDLE